MSYGPCDFQDSIVDQAKILGIGMPMAREWGTIEHAQAAMNIILWMKEKHDLAVELEVALRYAMRFAPPSADLSICHRALDRAEGKR